MRKRLMCIKDATEHHPMNQPTICFQEYHAIDETEHAGRHYWLIEELQHDHRQHWYEKDGFVELDGPDETEERAREIASSIFINTKNAEYVSNLSSSLKRET